MGRPARGRRRRARDRPRGARRSASATRRSREGDCIAIDGTTGCVTLDDVPLVERRASTSTSSTVLELGRRDPPARRARQRRHAGRRAQGARAGRRGHRPVPDRAHVHGRGPPAEDAGDDHGRRRRRPRRAALAELLPLQQEDFEGLFEAMAGLPVTIRLLDPPLHEFLPNLPDLSRAGRAARGSSAPTTSSELEQTLERVERDLTRRTRCSARAAAGSGSSIPRSTRCRSRRSCARRAAVRRARRQPHVEIMIPLVDYEHELEILRELVVRIGDEARADARARTTRSGR